MNKSRFYAHAVLGAALIALTPRHEADAQNHAICDLTGGSPPACEDACSADRELVHNGAVVSASDPGIFNTGTTRSQLTAAGATCDCAYGEEIYTSFYYPYLASGGAGMFSTGRLPACAAEPVSITMPAVSCPSPTGGGGGTDALLIAHMGGTDTAPSWTATHASHACLTDVVSACPPGYSRPSGADPTDAFTGISPHNCSAKVINPGLTGPVTTTVSTYALNVYSRLGYYVKDVRMYTFPSARPSTGVCPDGSDLDSDNKCPAMFTPLKVYQTKAALAHDYASGYLSSNATEFFGSNTTSGNYYTDNYNPSPADTLTLDTSVPNAVVESAFPLLSGYLAHTAVGKDMIAQRTLWEDRYSTLPHLDGTQGHLCQYNSWDGWSLHRGKPYIDNAESYFEDGISCPTDAPYDTTKGTCVYKNTIALAGPVDPTSTPSSSWCSGTDEFTYYITGGDGLTTVGEGCGVTFDLDSYRTVTPPHTDTCVVGHADYPATLYPPPPATPTNIPQNVYNDCMQFPASFPASPAQVNHTVSYYPQSQSVTINLAHGRQRDRATKTNTTKYRVARISAPTIGERKVTGHACRAGTLYSGWFGSPDQGGDDWGDKGFFCAEEPPGAYGDVWNNVWPSMCDGSPPGKPNKPAGTLTPGGMGISAATDPTGSIVEVLLPNGWRRVYPATGTPEATCAAVTAEATCQGTRGCAWGNGTCSNQGHSLVAPTCDCATYTGGSACPPVFPDACPSP